MPRHCNEIHHPVPCCCRYVIKEQNMRGLHGLMCSVSLHSQFPPLRHRRKKKITANRVSNGVYSISGGKKRKRNMLNCQRDVKGKQCSCDVRKNYMLRLNFQVYIQSLPSSDQKGCWIRSKKHLTHRVWQKIKPSTKWRIAAWRLLESSCRDRLLLKVKERLTGVYIAACMLNSNILILILHPVTECSPSP